MYYLKLTNIISKFLNIIYTTNLYIVLINNIFSIFTYFFNLRNFKITILT